MEVGGRMQEIIILIVYSVSRFSGWVQVGAIASIFMGGVACRTQMISDVNNFGPSAKRPPRTGAAWASFIFGDSPPKGRRLKS